MTQSFLSEFLFDRYNDFFFDRYNDFIGSLGPDTFDTGAGNDLILGDGEAAISSGPYAISNAYRFYKITYDQEPGAEALLQWVSNSAFQAARYAWNHQPYDYIPDTPTVDYSHLSNSEYVTLLYQNAFGDDREVDAAGMARWTGDIEGGSGGTLWARWGIINHIVQSPEFIAKSEATAEALAFDTASYANGWSDQIFRLYQATLDRAPTAQEMINWGQTDEGPAIKLTLTTALMQSTGFLNRFDVTDPDFVADLYREILGRDPDANGLARWTQTLQTEGGEAVILGITNSPEFTAKMADDLKIWIQDQDSYGNMIDAGGGTNMVAGGMFSDTFIFDADDTGRTLVIDLEPWDFIDLNGFGYTSVAEARAHMSETADHLVFDDQDVEVVLRNTALADITDDMILI